MHPLTLLACVGGCYRQNGDLDLLGYGPGMESHLPRVSGRIGCSLIRFFCLVRPVVFR
jgi:hypothetical protein